MAYKVKKAYKDKVTGQLNRIGDEVELSAARAKELAKGGFVEAAKAPKQKAAKPSAKPEAADKPAEKAE